MSYQYDVFISFSSTDRPWALELYHALKAKDRNPFLDRERLDGGNRGSPPSPWPFRPPNTS
jgi:hypothetical protein